MKQKAWWDAYPGRLEDELRRLDEEGIAYTRDESAWAKGVLRLDLSMQCDGETVELRASYPEFYPFFRVEVEAADLNLDHHQNPFGKNLCLMGRSTDLWHTNDTLASLLTDKLPIVLKTGRSNDISEVAGLEEHQAEPFADYFTYPPGASVIIAGGFDIPFRIKSGTLILGVETPGKKILRAALLMVKDEKRKILGKADQCIQETYSAAQITARWVRMDQAPSANCWATVFKACQEADPHRNKMDSFPAGDSRLQVRAALFPQETQRWRKSDYGWLFACRLEPVDSWEKRPKSPLSRKKR